MSLSFEKGSTLIITNGEVSRELLISSLTASQTYLEEEYDERDLYNNEMLKPTFTNELGVGNLDFSFNLTKYDDLFWKMAGLKKTGKKLFEYKSNKGLDLSYTIYVKRSGAIYKINIPVVQTVSLRMDFKDTPLAVDCSCEFSKWEEVQEVNAPNLTKQNSNHFIHGPISGLGSLAGVTLEFTKEVSWIPDKSLYQVLQGTTHVSTQPYLRDIALGGSITKYKTNDQKGYDPDTTIEFSYADSVTIKITHATVLERWETEEVDRIVREFKATPKSTAYIQF